MFFFLRKNNSVVILTIVFLICSFLIPISPLSAQLTTPTPPAAIPTGVPIVPAFAVMDAGVQTNTNILVTNTYSIAAILSGAAPGAVQDTFMVRLGKIVLKRILHELTLNIVAWIDSGFDGSPAFITDTKQFLLDTADKTVGDFIMSDPDLEFLCDPFKIQVKLALGLQYRPFRDQIECSFSEIAGNVDTAYEDFVGGDFIAGGGWNSWLKLTTQPQNNQMGAMIIAQGELDARITANKGAVTLEANWGNGFLSWKDCPPPTTSASTAPRDPSIVYEYHSASAEQCTIKTPGSLIANKINWADTSTIRELEIAQDIDAIFNALFNQALNFGMEILSDNGLLGSGSTQPDTSYQEYMAYLDTAQATLEAQNPANSTLIDSGGSSGTGVVDPNNPTVNPGTGVNYSDPVYSSKTNALALIDLMLGAETQFQTAQNSIGQLLTITENTFIAATCDATGEADIQTHVLNQISGTVSYTKTPPVNLSWNKADVALASTTAGANITALNNSRNVINSSTNETIITQTIQGLSSLQLHPQSYVDTFTGTGQNITDITDWIELMQEVYGNSATCNVDLSQLSAWGI